MSAPLDRFDVALLRLCSERVHEFMRTKAQENRAFELVQKGYLVRKVETYSVWTRGAEQRAQMRWAYKLSPRGIDAVKALGPKPKGGQS